MVSSYFNGSTIITGIPAEHAVILAACFLFYGVNATTFEGGMIYEENAPVLDERHGHISVGGTFHDVTTLHKVYALFWKRTGWGLGDNLAWQIAGRVVKTWCLP